MRMCCDREFRGEMASRLAPREKIEIINTCKIHYIWTLLFAILLQ
jgi:hypothetical protein